MNKQVKEAIELLKWVMEEPKGRILSDRSKEMVYPLAITALQQQLNNGWIPISERLPEEEKVYLISLKDECQEIIGFGIYDIEKKSWYADWLKNTEWIKQKVIIMAWQPLPEPYKAKELN